MASSNPTKTSLNETYLNEYSGHKLIAVSVTLIVLEVLCVVLRFVSRHLSKTAIGLDDWLIGPAFVFCLGLTVLPICMCGKVFILFKTSRSSRCDLFET